MNNKRLFGIALISFIFSLAGIVISALLLKEDVISTAKTVFEYFPAHYGVTPSTTWSGAIILGVFISVLQVVSASVAFSKQFSPTWRILAGVSFVASLYFDNWTDILFRSGYGTGDKQIATISTLAFYTFGSEITQSLSWLVVLSTWRVAISDLLWGSAQAMAKLSSIKGEWKRFRSAAFNKEFGGQHKDDNRPAQPQQAQKQEQQKTQPKQEPTYRPVTSMNKDRYNRQGLFQIHKPKPK